MAMKFNKNFSISKVVRRLVYTILALYVGGFMVVVIGNVMNCTASPFYQGLQLIGWTVTASNVPQTTGVCNQTGDVLTRTDTYVQQITDTGGSGVLAIVGIIGIASIIMEFVTF